jgi:uncharacterized protein YyaL (SSP411 family)
VWTLEELRTALAADDADAAVAWLGVTADGNFAEGGRDDIAQPGWNVLTGRGAEPASPEQRERIRSALMAARADRVRPGLDDKRLAAWNGLAIHAFAEAGAVLGRPDLVAIAVGGAEFVMGSMRDADGHLLRTWKDGQGKLNAYLEDHAFLLEALVALYEATFEPRWLAEARSLADAILARFADPEGGGFFATSSDHEQLVVRRKDIEDAPIPSGSSSAAVGLLRLSALTGDARYEEAAVSHLRLVAPLMGAHPQAFAHALVALDLLVGPRREVALAGRAGDPALDALAAVVRERLRPGVVLAGPPGDGVELMAGREPVDGRAAAYVCERFACRLPVTDADELRELLAQSTGR